jgi:hypothetical protein
MQKPIIFTNPHTKEKEVRMINEEAHEELLKNHACYSAVTLPEEETVKELQKDIETLNEPTLEDLSYEDLKGIAKSKELEFAGNIGKVKLIELIKGSEVE